MPFYIRVTSLITPVHCITQTEEPHFVNYKDKVIDLLTRVCTVSVETMAIIEEMENLG
jgi:hypothetical protein